MFPGVSSKLTNCLCVHLFLSFQEQLQITSIISLIARLDYLVHVVTFQVSHHRTIILMQILMFKICLMRMRTCEFWHLCHQS